MDLKRKSRETGKLLPAIRSQPLHQDRHTKITRSRQPEHDSLQHWTREQCLESAVVDGLWGIAQIGLTPIITINVVYHGIHAKPMVEHHV